MSFLTRSTLIRQATRSFTTRSFLRADAAPKQGLSGPAVQLRFVSANETLVAKPVHMVTIPAQTGLMGVLADHAPTIAQLKPGIVTVHGNDISDIIGKYFISGGMAIIKSDSSATVSVPESTKLEDLDAGLARRNLDEATATLQKATTDAEKAQAQIVIEVNEGILQALEQK